MRYFQATNKTTGRLQSKLCRETITFLCPIFILQYSNCAHISRGLLVIAQFYRMAIKYNERITEH